MKNTTGAGPVSPNWTGACFFDIEHLLLTAACQNMQVAQVAGTGFEQIEDLSGSSSICAEGSAKSSALSTEMHHLDPQLELLIEAWPTLSKAVQQQIMLLVG
jgi:hypothetical protein